MRALKATLTRPSQAPSQVEIARRIRLLDRVESLEELETALLNLEESLTERAARNREITAELAEIGGRGTATDADDEKLETFEALIREQLEEYGFSSVPPTEVELARDSYMPLYQERPLKKEKSRPPTT